MRFLRFIHFAATAFLFLACWLPTSAEAYCLENATSTPLHAQSLDSGVFMANIPSGARTCCQEAKCIGKKRPDSLLLIVTGYIPVGQAGQPGWRAECRIRVQAGSRVQVHGDVAHIKCERQARGAE
ncbi:MAG: hypothetical protein HQL63_10970 [Magnetococcales bacterium]|nr:hypothetical protein [Magnetococcales bacterium]